jgi:hypothetical protein
MTEPAPDPRTSAPQPPRPGKHPVRCPEPSTRLGATLYPTLSGLILWFLVDILSHIHITISWH